MAIPTVPPLPKPSTVEPANFVALYAVVSGLVTMQAEEFHASGRGPQATYIALLAIMCRVGLEAGKVTKDGAPAEKMKVRALQRLDQFFAGFHYEDPAASSQD